MKITKSQLKQIIKEELQSVLRERDVVGSGEVLDPEGEELRPWMNYDYYAHQAEKPGQGEVPLQKGVSDLASDRAHRKKKWAQLGLRGGVEGLAKQAIARGQESLAYKWLTDFAIDYPSAQAMLDLVNRELVDKGQAKLPKELSGISDLHKKFKGN